MCVVSKTTVAVRKRLVYIIIIISSSSGRVVVSFAAASRVSLFECGPRAAPLRTRAPPGLWSLYAAALQLPSGLPPFLPLPPPFWRPPKAPKSPRDARMARFQGAAGGTVCGGRGRGARMGGVSAGGLPRRVPPSKHFLNTHSPSHPFLSPRVITNYLIFQLCSSTLERHHPPLYPPLFWCTACRAPSFPQRKPGFVSC